MQYLLALPRLHKHALTLVADLLLLSLALWLAFSLRFDAVWAPTSLRGFGLLFITVTASVIAFIRLGLYRAIIRYLNARLFAVTCIAVTISTVVLVVTGAVLGMHIPPAVPILYWALALIFTTGTRIGMRYLVHAGSLRGRQPVIIYGAGPTGRELASALIQGEDYRPIAFLDDEIENQQAIIHGLRVYPPHALGHLLRTRSVEAVLLAPDNMSGRQKGLVLRYLENFQVRVQTVPSLSDVVAGKASISEIRDVDIEDLLGRDPVPPRPELLEPCIRNKVVMVTGAGGSIGSELCRQIALLGPCTLLLLDVSEYGLYRVERELRRRLAQAGVALEMHALLGTVQDGRQMERIMRAYGVDTVYHAAAY
ncbi:MAG: polysaccharide biosynthesis protein, partial [Gammaproteobacteria bacterium]|nr:polysaccharide biosynthesis protein [Gammaproteobacteria bacterium]